MVKKICKGIWRPRLYKIEAVTCPNYKSDHTAPLPAKELKHVRRTVHRKMVKSNKRWAKIEEDELSWSLIDSEAITPGPSSTTRHSCQ